MKVLKYGEGYPKTATCGNCQSELQYELNDIKHKYQWVDSADPLILSKQLDTSYIECPVCGEHITLDSNVTQTEYIKKWW